MNAQLAHWLDVSGLTKKEFARRIQVRAHSKGLSHVSTAPSRVRGWLAGQQPNEPGVADAVAEVLAEACGRPLNTEDLGFRATAVRLASEPTALAVVPELADALDTQSRMDLIPSTHDLQAEEAGIVSGDALLDAVEHIALGLPGHVPDPRSAIRIGSQHAAVIEHSANVFRRWDNEFGSGMRRKAVVGQLSEAAGLLNGPFQNEQAARQMFAAVADLAQLAGWMSYDLQLHATAQHYFLLGMHLAKDAGDRPQVARMLYCLARQMIDLGRHREALDMAQTGIYALRRAATPKAAAMLHIIEGRAHAGMGQASDCRRALGAAQDAFTRAGEDTDPNWCAFFDEAELCGLLGVTLRDLALADHEHARRHAADAQPWIQRAVEQRPRNYLRSQVMDIDSLAVVNVLLDEPETAAEAVSNAIAMSREVTSSRVGNRLRRTRRLAEARFPGMPVIMDLRDRTDALIDGGNLLRS